MKSTDLTITELAASVPKAVRDTEDFGVRGITRNGKAVAFLVSREVMESILETMELQKIPKPWWMTCSVTNGSGCMTFG